MKKQKSAIVTGSGGLIGSQSVKFLIEKGYYVIGIDNDMRSYFFGEEASTLPSTEKLEADFENFNALSADIRDMETLKLIFETASSDPDMELDLVIHCAAQPSHDWAAKEPLTDFTINAVGTLNVLECLRLYAPKATMIFTSTNKVYGDKPNHHFAGYKNHLGIKQPATENFYIEELETRNEAYYYSDLYPKEQCLYSFPETVSIDNSLHSVFGASKVAADVMCQEYGKYHNMNIGIFRGGCLTGPNHAGAELHGFLAYLVKCIVNNKPYTIYGNGKAVRDNIHSEDLLKMFWEFHQNPKPGEVYNAGGGRDNSTSVLEAIDTINRIAGTNWNNYTIKADEPRVGDHIWYISDLSKFKSHYPNWNITISLEETIKQMVAFEKSKIQELEHAAIN